MQTTNKADIVEQALFKATMIGSLFVADPLTQTRAGPSLEMMMTSLENDGIYLGWNKDLHPMTPDIDAESGLPDWSIDAITSLLANRMFQSVSGLSRPDLVADSVSLKRQLYPTELIQRDENTMMPVGQGNRSGSHSPLYQGSEEKISIENDGYLEDFFE